MASGAKLDAQGQMQAEKDRKRRAYNLHDQANLVLLPIIGALTVAGTRARRTGACLPTLRRLQRNCRSPVWRSPTASLCS